MEDACGLGLVDAADESGKVHVGDQGAKRDDLGLHRQILFFGHLSSSVRGVKHRNTVSHILQPLDTSSVPRVPSGPVLLAPNEGTIMEGEHEHITVTEAARRLGVSYQHTRRLIKREGITLYRMGTSARPHLLRVADVEWLVAKRQTAVPVTP